MTSYKAFRPGQFFKRRQKESDYKECADYAEYAEIAEYAEYAEYADYAKFLLHKQMFSFSNYILSFLLCSLSHK